MAGPTTVTLFGDLLERGWKIPQTLQPSKSMQQLTDYEYLQYELWLYESLYNYHKMQYDDYLDQDAKYDMTRCQAAYLDALQEAYDNGIIPAGELPEPFVSR